MDALMADLVPQDGPSATAPGMGVVGAAALVAAEGGGGGGGGGAATAAAVVPVDVSDLGLGCVVVGGPHATADDGTSHAPHDPTAAVHADAGNSNSNMCNQVTGLFLPMGVGAHAGGAHQGVPAPSVTTLLDGLLPGPPAAAAAAVPSLAAVLPPSVPPHSRLPAPSRAVPVVPRDLPTFDLSSGPADAGAGAGTTATAATGARGTSTSDTFGAAGDMVREETAEETALLAAYHDTVDDAFVDEVLVAALIERICTTPLHELTPHVAHGSEHASSVRALHWCVYVCCVRCVGGGASSRCSRGSGCCVVSLWSLCVCVVLLVLLVLSGGDEVTCNMLHPSRIACAHLASIACSCFDCRTVQFWCSCLGGMTSCAFETRCSLILASATLRKPGSCLFTVLCPRVNNGVCSIAHRRV